MSALIRGIRARVGSHPKASLLHRRVLAGVLTVLLGVYLAGPQVLSLGPRHWRFDLATVGLRIVEIDLDSRHLRGFGVADLQEPVRAEDYVAIATILLALATVVLALQTRRLVADAERQVGYLDAQASALQDHVRIASRTLDELRAAASRRGIVELRQHVHTINYVAINLSTVVQISRATPGGLTPGGLVADATQPLMRDAIQKSRSTCGPLYPRALALIDDLPFIGPELREEASASLISLGLLPEDSLPDAVNAAAQGWFKVRVPLLTALDEFQGISRTWRTPDALPDERSQPR